MLAKFAVGGQKIFTRKRVVLRIKIQRSFEQILEILTIEHQVFSS